MIVNELVNAVLQVAVFTLAPYLVYLLWYRRSTAFARFIGLTSAPWRANALAAVASLFFLIPPIALVIVHKGFRETLAHPDTMTGKIASMGWGAETLVVVLVIALIKTALAEEILFRGFLAKRLISMWGFQKGNLAHSILFGALHMLLFLKMTSNVGFLAYIFFFPSLGAYVSVYLNEKMAHGSILPGWIAHAMANVGSYTVIGLVIL